MCYRELKVKDAETALTATLRWRDEMKIDELMQETFPEDVFGGVGLLFGKDKGGRPVTYARSLTSYPEVLMRVL